MSKSSPAIRPSAAPPEPAWRAFLASPGFAKTIIVMLASWHWVVAGVMVSNSLTYPVIKSSDEDIKARMAYQISTGFSGYCGPNSVTYDMLNYTPLYYDLQARVIRWFGPDIRCQRVLALAFGCGALLMLALLVWRLTASWFLAYLAASLFVGNSLGAWYATLEPNVLSVALALAGLYLIVRRPVPSWSACLFATAVLFGSYWSKQTGLAYLAAGLFCIALRNWRKAAACAALAAALFAGTTWYYMVILKSTFLWNVFGFLSMEPILWDRLFDPVLFPQLLGRFGMLICAVAAGLLVRVFTPREYLRPEFVFFGAASTGIIASLKYGSGNGHHLMFYGMLIVCGLSLLHDLWRRGQVGALLVYAMLGVQCVALATDFRCELITPADEARFERVLSILGAPGKRTCFYAHGYYSILTGKPSYCLGVMDPYENYVRHRISYAKSYIDFWESDPLDKVVIAYPFEANSQLTLQYLQKWFKVVDELPAEVGASGGQELRQRLLVFERVRGTPAPPAP